MKDKQVPTMELRGKDVEEDRETLRLGMRAREAEPEGEPEQVGAGSPIPAMVLSPSVMSPTSAMRALGRLGAKVARAAVGSE